MTYTLDHLGSLIRAMERKRACVILTFKCLLFLVLFALFLRFYFIQQFTEFLKFETTYTTTFRESEEVKVPDMILCPHPPYKQDLLEEYNILEPFDAVNRFAFQNAWEDEPNITVSFQNLTYVLNKEYLLCRVQLSREK